MKKALCLCICFTLTFTFITSFADSSLLPTINSALRSNLSNKKIEVSDNLDAYSPLKETFSDINYDFKLIILQREAPQKEFTAKKVYPPFTSSDGFDDSFTGNDIGQSRIWLRSDLMAQLPSYFQATSLEDATYLIIAENVYLWDGTISVSDYKKEDKETLPEFETADEMALYFSQHPRVVDSITYYPKFGAYTLITIYEAQTKRHSILNYKYIPSQRFARNPNASDYWENMTVIDELLDLLNEGKEIDVTKAKSIIETADFIPQGKKDLWFSCINAEEYSTASHSISEYFWSMAVELRDLDPSSSNQDNYNLIIRDRNKSALSFFVNYCDYSGFDRSISSIEMSRDYMATPDYDWLEQELNETVLMFVQ